MEGRVIRVLFEETIGTVEGTQYVQQIEVEIASGSMQGQRIVTEHGGTVIAIESSRVKPGMRVIVEHAAGPVGDRYYISDFVRTLVGSLGLMMAVPVTSLIASWMAKSWEVANERERRVKTRE